MLRDAPIVYYYACKVEEKGCGVNVLAAREIERLAGSRIVCSAGCPEGFISYPLAE